MNTSFNALFPGAVKSGFAEVIELGQTQLRDAGLDGVVGNGDDGTFAVSGIFVPVVLALLKERSRYGYEMVRLVNARSNGALSWSEGTLYPVLHKLESDGLVRAYRQALNTTPAKA